MKSIMHSKEDHTCYLCQRLGTYPYGDLEEHHVFGGTANRKLSEKYGLKVYLCEYHHRVGPDAVHNNHDMMWMIQKDGQRAFEEKYPDKNFRAIFGKNYIWEEE